MYTWPLVLPSPPEFQMVGALRISGQISNVFYVKLPPPPNLLPIPGSAVGSGRGELVLKQCDKTCQVILNYWGKRGKENSS